MSQKMMIMIHKTPHGTIAVHEAVEVMFIMAAYEMGLSVVFTDDAVLSLLKSQDTTDIGIKGFVNSLKALIDWDVTQVYVDSNALEQRNVLSDQLTSIGNDEETDEPVYASAINRKEIRQMMSEQNHILSF